MKNEWGGRRNVNKYLFSVERHPTWWPKAIFGGNHIFNYSSQIIIQKYVNSLNLNTVYFWLECGNGKLKLLPQQ